MEARKDDLKDCAAGLATMKDALEKGSWLKTEIEKRAESTLRNTSRLLARSRSPRRMDAARLET